MSKLLIQDDILHGMDVYVEYTFDHDDESVVLYDYGIELTHETPIGKDEPVRSTIHASLRGFIETRWMVEKLEEYIISEHTVYEDEL
jgi:hypothetical protein